MADAAKNLLKIVVGLILVVAPIIALVNQWYSLWAATWTVIKGSVVIIVILIGLIFLLLGISELKA